MKCSILVVDDDPQIRVSLVRALRSDKTEVAASDSAEQALSRIAELAPDLVLSDVRMPGMDGLELLRILRERAPEVDVVLMTAHDDLPLVARAMHDGAVDFLVKPLDLNQLRRVLSRIVQDRSARKRSRQEEAADPARRLVGRDPQMIEIFKTVGQVASRRANVVIRGESGTGKELIARAIHDSSGTASEPFVAINCTAVPGALLESELFGHVKGAFTGAIADRRGRFALAGRGTIFLDEIGDTSLEFQAKLLRVLQEREYHPVGAERPERTEARVIAATHRDLEQRVRTGEFREDLYFRLRVVEIVVPPLRSRVGDIPILAEHLIAKAAHGAGIDPPVLSRDALDALLLHRWPGNVRELENCLTRAVILATGGVIRVAHLGLSAAGSSAPATDPLATLAHLEREHVIRVLEATGGHKARTARILGVSRPRLDRILRRYGLHATGDDA
jgi:DNA-binding NtrC family response regulator